jgi:(p)ppGpp synthase/HD superfamily hydrolase
MSELDDILLMAIKAHHGQTRWNGDPYIVHPVRVAKAAADRCWEEDSGHGIDWITQLRMVGLAHDLLEDTDVPSCDIEAHAGSRVSEAVEILTRPPKSLRTDTYHEYISRLIYSHNEMVMRIKLADLADNLSDLSEDHELRKRYEKAQARLERALEELLRD